MKFSLGLEMITYEPDANQLKKLLSLTQGEFRAARMVVKLYSEVLDTDIYLISDSSLAGQVDGVVYTAEEIAGLMKIRDALKPHYQERLRKIHDAKRIFGGKIVADSTGSTDGRR